LLNFARPQDVNLRVVDIPPLVPHAQRLMQSDLQGKRIDIRTNLNEKSQLVVLADSDMMTLVFLNLFINAAEAMPDGGQVSISATDQQNHIEIEISDTGSGISARDLPKIFDPFFTTKKGGTGLGLAIVYRLIEQMQGEIEVHSQENQGTTFKLRLRKGIQQS